MHQTDLDRYASQADAVAWDVGDLAIMPHAGIVRIASATASALELEPLQVFAAIDGKTHVPRSAASQHLVPVVETARAVELLALLASPLDRPVVAGDVDARRHRCIATLGFGSLARHRLALHQLYADGQVVEGLEAFVVGELALSLGREVDELRAKLRAAHAGASVAAGEAAFTTRGAVVGLSHRLKPGRWVVRASAVVHERETELLETVGPPYPSTERDRPWVARAAEIARAVEGVGAVQLGKLDVRAGSVWLVDAAAAELPDVVREKFAPIDFTLGGHGAHMVFIDSDAVTLRGISRAGELVLISFAAG